MRAAGLVAVLLSPASSFHAPHSPARTLRAAACSSALRMGEWVELGSCSTEVAAPASEAYSIISDYPRWPEWSPWLERVTAGTEDGVATSRWYLKLRAVKVDWTSRNVEEKPGSLIRWESTSGVRNDGTVGFTPTGGAACTLTIRLRYEIPRVVARLFSTAFVSRFVSQRLAADLGRFSVIAAREHRAHAARTGSAP